MTGEAPGPIRPFWQSRLAVDMPGPSVLERRVAIQLCSAHRVHAVQVALRDQLSAGPAVLPALVPWLCAVNAFLAARDRVPLGAAEAVLAVRDRVPVGVVPAVRDRVAALWAGRASSVGPSAVVGGRAVFW